MAQTLIPLTASTFLVKPSGCFAPEAFEAVRSYSNENDARLTTLWSDVSKYDWCKAAYHLLHIEKARR